MYSSHLLFLGNLFSSDMLVIAFIALLLFGGEKLPELARGARERFEGLQERI